MTQLAENQLQPDLQAGDLARHDLGLTVRIVGMPRIILPQVPRLRCQVLDPGPTGLARGQQATFRVAHLTPL